MADNFRVEQEKSSSRHAYLHHAARLHLSAPVITKALSQLQVLSHNDEIAQQDASHRPEADCPDSRMLDVPHHRKTAIILANQRQACHARTDYAHALSIVTLART